MPENMNRRSFGSAVGWLAAGSLFGTSANAQQEFYSGKHINIIVGYGTGGGYDVYARIIAKHMARFIPGQPSIVVQNMPGAGSLRALNHLYNAAPQDGTVIAMFSPSMPMQAILGNNPSVKFDALKLTWLGSSSSFADDGYLLVIRTDGSNKTIEDVRRSESQPIIIGSSGPGSNSHDIPVVLRDTIGLRYKMVNGYPGSK